MNQAPVNCSLIDESPGGSRAEGAPPRIPGTDASLMQSSSLNRAGAQRWGRWGGVLTARFCSGSPGKSTAVRPGKQDEAPELGAPGPARETLPNSVPRCAVSPLPYAHFMHGFPAFLFCLIPSPVCEDCITLPLTRRRGWKQTLVLIGTEMTKI